MEHALKISARWFDDVREGRKTFEMRYLDRPFARGDILHLWCFDPIANRYTMEVISVGITNIYYPFDMDWIPQAHGLLCLDGDVSDVDPDVAEQPSDLGVRGFAIDDEDKEGS